MPDIIHLIVLGLFLVLGAIISLQSFGSLLDYMVERGSNRGSNRGIQIGSWKTHLQVGRPEIRKVEKAAIARIGLGANDSEETIYWNAFTDNGGKVLTSDKKYKISFKSEPLLNYENFGFWSITVYGENKFFVPNRHKKYSINSISSRQLDPIFLSREEPDEKERWLPLPQSNEKISLAFRCYLPLESMKKGKLSREDLPVIEKL